MTDTDERFKFMIELVDYFQKLSIEKGDIFVVSLNAEVSDRQLTAIKESVEAQLKECFPYKVPVFVAVGGMLEFNAFKIRAKKKILLDPNVDLIKG